LLDDILRIFPTKKIPNKEKKVEVPEVSKSSRRSLVFHLTFKSPEGAGTVGASLTQKEKKKYKKTTIQVRQSSKKYSDLHKKSKSKVRRKTKKILNKLSKDDSSHLVEVILQFL